MRIRRLTRLAHALVATALVVGCGQKSVDELVASSTARLAAGDAAAAIVDAKAALQAEPNSAAARFALGQALFQSAEYFAASVEFDKALKLKHPPAAVYPLLAQSLLRSGRVRIVVEAFQSVQIDDPKAMATVKAALGTAYGVLGQHDKADTATAAALALDPANPDALLNRARSQARVGQTDAAMKSVEALIAQAPKMTDAWLAKGELQWWALGDPKAAAKTFEKCLELEPRHVPAHRLLIWMALGERDTEGFAKRVEAMRKVLPNHPDARLYDAQLALIRRDHKKALETLQVLLKRMPDDVRVLTLAGTVELAAGSPAMAVTHLSKAVGLAPKSAPARHQLAQAYLRSGDPARALAVLQPLIDAGSPRPETLSIAAMANLLSGRIEQAETLFNRVVKLAPGDQRARTALALAQIARGQAGEGFAELEALAAQDKGIDGDMALISARIRLNDLDGALAGLARLEAKQPGLPLAHQVRGQVQLRRNDMAGARQAFDKALTIDPKYYPAIAHLAAIDIGEGKLDDAIRRLDAHLKDEPRSYGALATLVALETRRGTAAERITERLRAATRANPGDAPPRLMLVDHLLSVKQFGAALNAAQEADQAVPKDTQIIEALGRAQQNAGDLQQALATFGKLAGLQPTAYAPHLRLAETHRLMKSRPLEMRSYQRALEIDPKALPAQMGLIRMAVEDKRYAEAIAVTRTIQKQRPDEPVGHQLEADLHIAQKQLDAAATALRAAVERDPSGASSVKLHSVLSLAGRAADAEAFANQWLKGHPRDHGFLFHLGNAAIEQKNLAQAESRFRAGLAIDERNVLALNNLAWLLNLQRKPEGLAYAQKAVDLAPGNPSVIDTYAQSLAVDGQTAKALEWQRKAVQMAGGEKSPPALRLNLAKLLIKAGDKAAARDELGRLQALGDALPQQAEVRQLIAQL